MSVQVGTPERVEEQLHRSPNRPRVGLTGKDHGGGFHAVDQFTCQPRLADARLAGDQRHGGRTRGADEGLESAQLGRAAHHHRREARAGNEHAPSVRRTAARAIERDQLAARVSPSSVRTSPGGQVVHGGDGLVGSDLGVSPLCSAAERGQAMLACGFEQAAAGGR